MANGSVDPAFCIMCSHSMANSFFFFFLYYLKKIYFFEKDLESPLIFVLFLKGKTNKKKNPKCDSLFGKDSL